MRRGGDSTEILGRLRNFARLSSPAARRVAAMVVDALIVLESFVIALLLRRGQFLQPLRLRIKDRLRVELKEVPRLGARHKRHRLR